MRIVSGAQEHDPNAPLLQGLAIGRQFREAQRSRELQQREQQEYALQMRRLNMQMQEQRAKHQEILTQASEQGDIRALEEMQMRSQMSPEQLDMDAAFRTVQGIQSEEGRKQALPLFAQIVKGNQRQRQMGFAQQQIERNVKDGFVPEDQAQGLMAELEAGGDPDGMIRRLSATRQQAAEKSANMGENQEWLDRSKQFVASLPPSQNRKMMMQAISGYEMNSGLMEDPDTGTKLWSTLQKMAIPSDSELRAQQNRQAKDLQGFGTMMQGDGMEATTKAYARQTSEHQRAQKAEKERRYPGSTTVKGTGPKTPTMPRAALKKAKSEEDVISALQAAGIPLTHANITAAANQWRGRGE